jgi:hypothetical protein
MANERNIGMFFKVSEYEHDLIKKKMALFGTKNQSAYLRKMVIDGYVIRLELEQFQEMLSLMRRTSNNVNQIAKRCNETRNLYETDVEDLKQGYDALCEQMKGVISELATLRVL